MPDNIRDRSGPTAMSRLGVDRECHRKHTARNGKGEKAG